MDVLDVFCGVGGFSAGAIAAGATVIAGIDQDSVPLKAWCANTGGQAHRISIGVDEFEWPPPRSNLHVHLSPPCTEISRARVVPATVEAKRRALDTLRWCVHLAIRKKYPSWSIETVATVDTKHTLAALQKEYGSELVSFTVLDAADFSTPSSRVRLIAAPYAIVKNLEEQPVSRISVRQAFAQAGVPLPAEFIRCSTKKRDGTGCIRSVDLPSYTVTASHPLTFCNRNGSTVRCLKVFESAILMGLGAGWKLPTGSRKGTCAIGNMVPVGLARAIMQAAFESAP